MNNVTITPLGNEHCDTGENPYWTSSDGCVYWTDIPRGKLFRYDTQTGTHETIYQGEPVGGFTLQKDGSWLLFRVNDIVRMTPEGVVTSLLPFADETAQRFNDVIADAQGRVFAGTIGADRESGGLYRVDLDGTITKLFAGTGCANGMGFTSDLSQFYWTCSTNRQIFRFRYDPETGALTDRELFYQSAPDEATPDGMVVDSSGIVWSAQYGSSAILKLDPTDGRIVDRITLPVSRITSLTFGGSELDTMYVTTAGGKTDVDSADGTLYSVTGSGATGQPEFLSNIRP
ncbi:MAG: SMP-30/gluconolactonase/LRE family protein [Armatimonadota bacterium]